MRILQVNNINDVASMYADELRARGHTVAVYEPNLRGASSPLPAKLALMPERILDLRRIVVNLNPRKYDMAHIHWASYGVLGLLSRIPYIVECHGSDIRYRLAHPFFHTVLTSVFRHASAVMCITPDLLPIVRSVRPDAIFLPGPIDTDQFAPIEQEQSDPWTILLFARLDSNKGTQVAVQGIARFIRRRPDVCVQLLDWGDDKEHYKRHYGEHFEFIPRVAPQMVQHLIRSADVIVGQFLLGALGLSELQAMSCAKPVIASFRYEDAYSSPPPLCCANTVEEVDEHLENLYQHPEFGKNIGQKSREWVIKNHERRLLAGKLETLYQSIIERIGSSDSVKNCIK